MSKTNSKLTEVYYIVFTFAVDSINLPTIRAVFNDLGYAESFTENKISVQQLEEILVQIFTREHDRGEDINVISGVDLTLNWLLNVYDQ